IHKLLALQPCNVHMQVGLLATLAFAVTSVSTCTTEGESTTCDSFSKALDVANLTISSNCTLPQSSFNTSFLFLQCPITNIPHFSLRVFPRLQRLILADCNISSLPWQSLSLTNEKLSIDLSNCPLSCSCDNAWLNRNRPPYFSFPLIKVAPLTCNFSQCPTTQVTISTKLTNTFLNSPFSLKTIIDPPSKIAVIPPLPYYGWISNWPGLDPTGEETVSPSSIDLKIDRIHEDHLGRIVVRCWHCTDPLYDLSEVRFPTRARAALAVDPAHHDTHILKLRGHPMDDVTLMVTHLEPDENGSLFSEEKALDARNQTTFLDGALIVRPMYNHWSTPFRTYEVFSSSCAFCDFDHPTGKFSFKVCERGRNSSLVVDDERDCEELLHD
ncbi:hypothetical protein PFISCL1PPCAC_22932, partial [Pristionchus fissidentatus]